LPGADCIGTITWSNGTVDTIRVQSDAIPESASIFLLLTGLGLLCIASAAPDRRWKNACRSGCGDPIRT